MVSIAGFKLPAQHRRFILPAIILLVALSLRLYRLDFQSLWADEGNSAVMATRSLSAIALHAAGDIHPPLYYWMLRIWAQFLGTSEWALRALSAFAGVMLTGVVFALGWELAGEKVGLAGMLLAAFHPFMVYYSQEARMYIFIALFGALSMLAAIRWWRRERLPAGVLYVVTTASGLYTHYSFPLMLAVENLAFLAMLLANGFRRRIRTRRYVMIWFALQALSVLLYVPWMPIARRRLTSWPALADYDALTALREALKVLAVGPIASVPWWFYPLLGALVLGGVATRLRKDYGAIITLMGWLLAPLVMMLALGLYRGAYLKFLLIASPALCILVARGLDALAGLNPSPEFRWLPPLGAATLLGCVLFSFSQSLGDFYFHFTKDDYRSIARYIEAVEEPGDSIILNAPGQEEVFSYYYRGDLPIYPLPRKRPPRRAELEAELELITSHPGRIFALFWGSQEADPEGIVESWLKEKAFKVSETWKGNVRFVVYSVPEFRTSPEMAHDLGWRFGDPVLFRLTGYVLGAERVESGGVMPVVLTWQSERETPRRYKITVQLLNEKNQVVSQYDAEPGGGRRPTNTWQPGEVIVDNIGLMVKPGTPPGQYRLILAMYDAKTGKRLPVKGQGADGDHIEAGTVEVTRPTRWPPVEALGIQHRRDARFGPLEMLGYDIYKRGFAHAPDTPIKPGDIVQVNIYWRAQLKPRQDWFVALSLVGKAGEIASAEGPAAGTDYPTSQWVEGEIVRAQFDLALPLDVPPGEYRLFLKLGRGTTQELLPPMVLAPVKVSSGD